MIEFVRFFLSRETFLKEADSKILFEQVKFPMPAAALKSFGFVKDYNIEGYLQVINFILFQCTCFKLGPNEFN